MATYTVGYFVGSLSSTSINRQLAEALVKLAPPELSMTEIPIRDLPLYSQDYDADFPPVARKLKEAIAQARPHHAGRRGHRRKKAEFLRNYMTELHAFIVRVLTVLPRQA